MPHLGIDPAELPLVVLDELHGLRLEVSESRSLSKGRHFKGQVLFLSVVEALTLKMTLVRINKNDLWNTNIVKQVKLKVQNMLQIENKYFSSKINKKKLC